MRVVRDPSRDGVTNMAIDEAILEAVGAGPQPSTLRLYRWSPPALSLGYSQPYADADIDGLRGRGWGLVRRPTGGRAILHADELTYSICGTPDGPFFAGGVLESYRRLSHSLARALRSLGLPVRALPAPAEGGLRENPVCFEVPSAFELEVDGRKVCGSAQLRRRMAVLQHGSIPLAGDLGRITEALAFQGNRDRGQARMRLLQRAGTVSGLLGRRVGWDEMARAIEVGFSEELGVELRQGELSSSELANADALAAKHRSDEWLQRI